MRLFIKFSAVVALAVCCQLLFEMGLDPLDEAQFTTRVYVAHLCGAPPDSPELIDMGTRMIERQIAREQARRGHRTPATRPMYAAAADELDW